MEKIYLFHFPVVNQNNMLQLPGERRRQININTKWSDTSTDNQTSINGVFIISAFFFFCLIEQETIHVF